MKILIASDSHDQWQNLTQAVAVATERQCEIFLHAGDFISPPGLECFRPYTGEVHLVWGNNDGDKIGLHECAQKLSSVRIHGDVMEATFDGLRFHMNHYPGNAENAFLSLKYDVVVYGHTHQYRTENHAQGGIIINPGELQGFRTGTPSVALFDTATRLVTRIDL